VDVLPVFLPVHDGLSVYYMCSYLCMVDQVDVLHWFLPVYDGLSERITCDPTCVR
jgi:hypothetical protein